ncbi:MAG TPA: TerB family tellurite resistance protein [Polyangia bacterium]|nr:TerB family tellurite resistance protein [Polyangia bacterium]
MDNRVARCHLLAEVLAADGIMTDDERALLERHLANHELSEEEKREVRDFQDPGGAIAVLRERPSVEKQEIVDQLVEAALADGKLTANETAAVKRIAHALGLDD